MVQKTQKSFDRLVYGRRLVAMAASSVLAVASSVMAQYQVDRSGANDANTRAGSGGINQVDNRPRPWDVQNNIVYGNVTSGKQFRGDVGSRDPFAFRGVSAGTVSDNFVRDSAGVTTNGFPTYNAQQTHAFYGDSRAVAPPPGFLQVPGGGGYVPPQPTAWRNVDPRQSALSEMPQYAYRSDIYGLAGPVDMVYAPNAVAVPPVFQARPAGSDYTQLNQDLQNYLSPTQIQDLQKELADRSAGRVANAVRNTEPVNPLQGGDSTGERPTVGQQPGGQSINQAGARSANDMQQSDATASSAANDRVDPSAGEIGMQQPTMRAGQQSLYMRLLERRKAQLGDRPGMTAQAEALAAADLKRQNERTRENAAADDQPTPRPPANPGNNPAEPPKPADKTPLKVNTLTSDQAASGLNDTIRKAEGLLREGKFTTALETYEAAERTAPQNTLVKLGKVHAELGGGFYRRAEGDLRAVLTADQNLLAGQYDLRAFLGDDRLQVIERDLRDQMQKNENDAGPAVLLAYVYYNTSNERRAAALLDLADKRAGGKDGFVKLLKQNWALPSIEGENK